MRNATRSSLALALALVACDRDAVGPDPHAAARGPLALPSASYAVPSSPLVTVTDLDVLTGRANGWTAGVNDGGVVVGTLCTTYPSTTGTCEAARWVNGAPTLLPLPAGGFEGRAEAVNSSGVIVGTAEFVPPGATDQDHESHVLRWLPGASAPEMLSPGISGRAVDINDAGYVVGTVTYGGDNAAALWNPPGGSPNAVLLQPSASGPLAHGINNAGAIVGEKRNSTGDEYVPAYWPSSSASAQELPLPQGDRAGVARDIADDGTIIGWVSATFLAIRDAAVWSTPNAQPVLLPKPSASADCLPQAISDFGVIVGICDQQPVLWAGGQIYSLGGYGVPTAITKSGLIARYYTYTFSIPQTLQLLFNPALVAKPGGPYAAGEGTSVTFDGTASTGGSSGSPLAYEWDFGDGTTGTGPAPAHTYADDGIYTVTLKVRSGSWPASPVATTSATITDVAPRITAITLPPAPAPLGTQVTVQTAFAGASVDRFSATVMWGDGTSSPLSAVTSGFAATHTYATPGVYAVRARVTDDDGSSDEQAATNYVVVYDGSAGSFVNGVGSIDSPAGAMPTSPAMTGRATFGFESRYANGAQVPSGFTRFGFRAGALDFQATRFDWLVVAGTKAQFKGEGTIAGRAGTFQFMVTAVDNGPGGPSGGDRFRIKITAPDGTVVYDNQLGASDGAQPTTTITSGNITVKS